VRGAFTSAVADKKGLLQIAEGGSFFLDELGEMALPTQVKFLRVLETREFLPVGSTAPLSADVRFITATNRDLEEMVDEGTFREDLFYRLNVIPIHLPPLRERREDIPLLAGHFLARHAQKQNKPARGFAPDAINFLVEQDWPGNIRELENTIQRAVTLSSRDSISRGDLEQLRRRTSSGDSTRIRPAQAALGEDFDLEEELARVERNYLGAALRQAEGNMTRAAELLGISFRQMRYKVKKLDVQI
jgi:DNA-binding NtrC family response regulator